MRNYTQRYTNGGWTDSESNEIIGVINPATEEVIGKAAKGNEKDVEKVVQVTRDVYLEPCYSSVEERKQLLDRIVEEYKNRKQDIIEAIIAELGVPLIVLENIHYQMGLQHFSEVRRALDSLEFEERRGDDLVTKEAIGVSRLVTPWNFPTSQISLRLVTTPAAGSLVVLKPSEETPFAAIILAGILEKAGVPKGAFNLVNGDGEGVGNPLGEHPKIRMISFIGSGATGSKIMEKAAKGIKKVSLELGSKSPYIVLNDIDIREAARATTGRVANNTGQVCTAGTRISVPESIKQEFLTALKEGFGNVKVGGPLDKDIQVGPTISKKQFDTVQSYIGRGIEEGAELLYGGPGKPEGLDTGYPARPTIFINVRNDMTIAQEEIFGPVVSVITYNDLDEATEIINNTKYGLAGYVIGKDKETLQKMACSIEAGRVQINESPDESYLPLGDYKQSGIGHEWGNHGTEEFLEVKSIAGYFK